MKSYQDLSVYERLDKYRYEIGDAESKILKITRNPYHGYVFETLPSLIAVLAGGRIAATSLR